MNMKSIVYSGVLLLGLVVVSILLNRGTIHGVASSADVSLNLVGPAGSTLPNTLPGTLPSTGTSTNYIVGQVVSFSGSIAFAANEQQSLNQIRLVNDSGPQALDVTLPLAATSDYITLTDSSIPGTIEVKVTHTNITASYAYSTLGTMGNTIPGTLPSSDASGAWAGGTFKGLSGGGSITFDVKWSPGIFLDPRPDFTLIPDTDLAFEIPTLPTPVAVSGTALPSTTAVYTIPTADASTASSVLPAGSGTFDVPTVTITTTASGERATVPDLPALDRTANSQGFAIPDLMSWAVGSSKITTSTGSTYPTASGQFTVPTTAS
ncbi:MAG: hypothetical protein QF530_08275, partial [SAR202 cluster bacterium]|nr:hypothetical protein [SAR202 cluster bacterium]